MLCYQIFTIWPREVEATDKIGMHQALQAMLHFMSWMKEHDWNNNAATLLFFLMKTILIPRNTTYMYSKVIIFFTTQLPFLFQ